MDSKGHRELLGIMKDEEAGDSIGQGPYIGALPTANYTTLNCILTQQGNEKLAVVWSY